MNLSKKKKLAKRAFNVGEDRIIFLESRLDEIKEAITKQDILDLFKSGAIIIKETKGRRKVYKQKNRSTGNIRKKSKKRKRGYIILTRNLRDYLRTMIAKGKITKERMPDLSKKIRNRFFKNKTQLKEYLEGVKK